MKRLYYLGFIALMLLGLSGCNEKTTLPPAISVTGTARIYVEPDEVSISMTLRSKDAVLIKAKKKNDGLLQKFQSILKDFSIEKKNIALNRSTVQPEYRYSRDDERILTGYTIRQNISVKIKDLTKYEPFVTALLNAGIDRIHETRFSNSELKKHRADARKKAVEAAIEKARLLCTAAEVHKPVTLGKILDIHEGNSGSNYRSRVSRLSQANYESRKLAADNAVGDMGGEGLVPIGAIPIEATVDMTFALE